MTKTMSVGMRSVGINCGGIGIVAAAFAVVTSTNYVSNINYYKPENEIL